MGCFSIDKTALKMLITKMDEKIYAYSKNIAKIKVGIRSNNQSIQGARQTVDLKCIEDQVNFLQDSVDCFILLREYCDNLLKQVTDMDRMLTVFLNSCLLNLQEFSGTTNKNADTDNYVTDSNGNRFYRALYSDLTPHAIEQLSTIIGEDTVQKLCVQQNITHK